MDILTREQAIHRIRDIYNGKSINHFLSFTDCVNPHDGMKKYGYHRVVTPFETGRMQMGAIRELMAIFDITEDDLT